MANKKSSIFNLCREGIIGNEIDKETDKQMEKETCTDTVTETDREKESEGKIDRQRDRLGRGEKRPNKFAKNRQDPKDFDFALLSAAFNSTKFSRMEKQ